MDYIIFGMFIVFIAYIIYKKKLNSNGGGDNDMPIIIDFVSGQSIIEEYTMTVGNDSAHISPASYGYRAFNDAIFYKYGSMSPATFTFDKSTYYTISDLNAIQYTDSGVVHFNLVTTSQISVNIKSISITATYNGSSVSVDLPSSAISTGSTYWEIYGYSQSFYNAIKSWNGKTISVTVKVNF